MKMRIGCCAVTGLVALTSALGLVPSAAAGSQQLDPTFGQGGKFSLRLFDGNRGFVAAAARHGRGYVIVANIAAQPRFNAVGGDLLVARFTRTGRLDRRFGKSGITRVSPASGDATASDVAVRRDGRIVVSGTLTDASGTRQAMLSQLWPKGDPDAGFGAGGTTYSSFGAPVEVHGITLDGEGAVLLTGYRAGAAGTSLMAARYGATGQLDTQFGVDGVFAFPVTAPVDSHASGEDVISSRGGYLIGGTLGDSARQLSSPLLVRLGRSGELDRSFGPAGQGYLVGPGDSVDLHDLLVLRGGRIRMGGSETDSRDRLRLWVAAATPSGRLDTSFGSGGHTSSPFPGYELSSGYALARAPRGRVLVAGTALRGAVGGFALAQYMRDGSLDGGFGRKGRTVVRWPSGWFVARSLLNWGDGAALAVGGRVFDNPADASAVVAAAAVRLKRPMD